jgi:3-oxoacyl-[acyl-carrier protein] reductase
MRMELEGKGAIITGAGTGVGRATALAFARRGCSVLVNYSRSREEAEKTAAEAEALGVRAVPFQADVVDDVACRSMVETAVRELGAVQILVNNAGATIFVPHPELEKVSDEDWSHVLEVNVVGPFHCVRAARGAIENAGGGEIVNVSSVAGLAGVGSSIPYCASKAALNNLTLTLARALAPKIRVNAICPGFITGRWLQGGLGPAYEPVKQAMEQRAPLGRVCDPEDVSEAILSIVTGSDLITGQITAIDGGMLIAG